MDRLSGLFTHFAPSVRTFYAGDSCRVAHFAADAGYGTIHLLRQGRLTLTDEDGKVSNIGQPAVLFFPRPASHTLEVRGASADLLCASIDLGSPDANPLSQALPRLTVIPLADMQTLEPVLEVLFAESARQDCGRQQALDSLIEYFLVVLLRYLVDSEQFRGGLLAGLADRRLARALSAMHEKPGRPWSLEDLAAEAGMSRARFAVNFRETLAVTPMDYLLSWRMGLAQTWLRRGYPIKRVASRVGYRSPAALTRAFRNRLGMSPREWLKQIDDTAVPLPPTLENYVPRVPQAERA
jgi:AraC-like DNA-binding protein